MADRSIRKFSRSSSKVLLREAMPASAVAASVMGCDARSAPMSLSLFLAARRRSGRYQRCWACARRPTMPQRVQLREGVQDAALVRLLRFQNWFRINHRVSPVTCGLHFKHGCVAAPSATSLSWLPSSTRRPPSSTTMRSAMRTVEKRWDISSAILP